MCGLDDRDSHLDLCFDAGFRALAFDAVDDESGAARGSESDVSGKGLARTGRARNVDSPLDRFWTGKHYARTLGLL